MPENKKPIPTGKHTPTTHKNLIWSQCAFCKRLLNAGKLPSIVKKHHAQANRMGGR